MEKQNEHSWHIMLYYFREGKNVTEAAKKICNVYSTGHLQLSIAIKNWYPQFTNGEFELTSVWERSGQDNYHSGQKPT